MSNFPFKIIKEYPKKGPLSQFRFEVSVSFVCFRCSSSKKSKLISIYSENWDKKLCNGCYGRLLSLYKIGSNPNSVEQKFKMLDREIEKIWNTYSKNLKQIEIKISNRQNYSERTLKYLITAEYYKNNIPDEKFLEWSPAIISLCKAVESELVEKFLDPMKDIARSGLRVPDQFDKRTVKIERYIFGLVNTPPELGGVAFFSGLLANSENYRTTSNIASIFKEFCRHRPLSEWFYLSHGLQKSLNGLVQGYRNKAAHYSESDLSKEDFLDCERMVSKESGILDKLSKATATH